MRILIISIVLFGICALGSGPRVYSGQLPKTDDYKKSSNEVPGVVGPELAHQNSPVYLAQAHGQTAATTIPQNTTVNKPNPSDEYNHVESIGF